MADEFAWCKDLIHYGDLEGLNSIFEKGFDLNTRDVITGDTMLHNAAQC